MMSSNCEVKQDGVEPNREDISQHGSEPVHVNTPNNEEMKEINPEGGILGTGENAEPPVKKLKVQLSGDAGQAVVPGTTPTGSNEVNTTDANPSDAKSELPPEMSADGGPLVDVKVEKNAEEILATPMAAKKDSKPFDDDDVFATLDWKDGVATLPGSDLKFKLTEFGTLEIVSTVETEKGKCEWSTKTEHHTLTSDNVGGSPSVSQKSPGKGKSPKSKATSQGPPGSANVLCCEVCGKYGLPQDFSASGRFCSLSCVGAYTGRRNKGREFVRHIKTIDGKIIKRKKKKGKKTEKLGDLGGREDDAQLFIKSDPQEEVSDKPKVKRMKRKIRKGGKHLTMNIDPTKLNPTEDVPYDPRKPFSWQDYLTAATAKPVPHSVFKQENPDLELFPKSCPGIKKDMKLEAVDPKHPSYICVCTIVRVQGCRLRLHFDGWSESYDFWTNVDSPFIFPVGWAEKNGQFLYPPRSAAKVEFNWERYLKKTNAKAVPEELLKPVPPTQHGFKVGMKLEAVDRKNPDLICVATVTNVIGNRFLVHFDEWEDTYDYWCEDTCPYIHPVGWCAENDKRLNPPNDDEVDTFTWDEYLSTTGSVAAHPDLFKMRAPSTFKKGQKLEAVDKRNPSLVRAATVADTEDYRVWVHYDGWDDIYDDWFDTDSCDVHPVEWCSKTGHPLEPPLTTAEKLSSAACPTPGCKGIGHVKGAKYSTHHSTFGCPYSLQNLNKDSCLVDRLSANSMTEESDWSYASKNKTTDGKAKMFKWAEKPAIPAALKAPAISSVDGVCPTIGCDGSGHVTGTWKTHHTLSGCPRYEGNYVKGVPRALHNPGKRSYSTSVSPTSPTSPKSIKSNVINTRGSLRRQSVKEEKIRPHAKYAEKGVQHVSPFSFPWPLGRASSLHAMQAALAEDSFSSSERRKISKWTVEEVAAHVRSLGCVDQAKLFIDQQIDGEAFLLMKQSDIVNILKIKLGPALKIANTIPKY